jgi:chromosome segregation ATPase
MYHFEQREKFWDGKSEDLRNKLYSRPFGRSQNPPKLKPSPKEVNYEEMRLMNSLAKEEITELKSLLSSEKGRNLHLHRNNEELRGKLEELQDLNQSLTNLLIDKGKNSAPSKRPLEKELSALREELENCQSRLAFFESQENSSKEMMESRLAALKNEVHEKNLLIDELHGQLKAFSQNSNHAPCEARLAEYLKKIQSLESQVFSVSPKENSQKLQLLEEENQMLKEQIEIYQEDKIKDLSEKEKMQKLSYFILSKEKNQENEGRRKNQEISNEKNLENENKTLVSRLNLEMQGKLENLEKIKNLQEILMKIAPDCGYDHDLTRVKAQIIAVKGQINGNITEKVPSQVELYEKTVEIDILKNEIKAAKSENSRIKEEFARNSEKVREMEVKVRVLEAGVNDKDLVCFVQCEAAALEDMLGGNCTQDLDSEEIY